MSMKYYDNSHNVYEPYQSYVRTFLNPYSPMSRFVITIHYPKVPNYNQEKEIKLPEISLNDLLGIMPQFQNELDEHSNVYTMFEFFVELAKETISFEAIKKPKTYEYLCLLYIAHNLELSIRAFKDEANIVSLNNEVSEKNYYINDMTKLLEKGETSTFALTYYGKRFEDLYSKYLGMYMRGSLSRKRGVSNDYR